ncbi:MAG: DUF4399 domain-containing protein [Mariprofundaceae bacterium]|nr:DUF4399 domain-containing protein [Mariprofundaceae bacterium]
MSKILNIVIMALLFSSTAWANEDGKQGVYFVMPSNASTHQGEVHLVMAVNGMAVQKAGVLKEGTGHFHVIVDGGFVAKGSPVAKNATHIHFGKGQVEAKLELPDGEHTLTLQFADGHHISYGAAWSQTVRVNIK